MYPRLAHLRAIEIGYIRGIHPRLAHLRAIGIGYIRGMYPRLAHLRAIEDHGFAGGRLVSRYRVNNE